MSSKYLPLALGNLLLMLGIWGCPQPLENPLPTPSEATPSSTPSPIVLSVDNKRPGFPEVLVPHVTAKVIAGTGKAGYKDGPALEAEFDGPSEIVSMENGDLYIGEVRNNRIRKLGKEGQVSTVAGTGKYSVSTGKALSSEFFTIQRMVKMNEEQIYFHSVQDIIFSFDLVKDEIKVYAARKSLIDYLKDTETKTINSDFLPFKNEVYSLVQTQGKTYFSADDQIYQILETGKHEEASELPSQLLEARDFVITPSGEIYSIGEYIIKKYDSTTQKFTNFVGKPIPDPSEFIPSLLGGFSDGALDKALIGYSFNIEFYPSDQLLLLINDRGLRLVTDKAVYTLIKDMGVADLNPDNSNTLYGVDESRIYQIQIDMPALVKYLNKYNPILVNEGYDKPLAERNE